MAKRTNSYSAAMGMTYKTGESRSNGAPPTVDNATEFETFALSSRFNEIQHFEIQYRVFFIISF